MSTSATNDNFMEILGAGTGLQTTVKNNEMISGNRSPNRSFPRSLERSETFCESSGSSDKYYIRIKDILQSTNTGETKFRELFLCRYAMYPQLENDPKTKELLSRSSLSDNEMMILTQKHFNDFAGALIIEH